MQSSCWWNSCLVRESANICKSIVGNDASELYPYSMCQLMPTGLCTRWDFDLESSRFKPRQNKTRSFENMVMSCFQRTWPECEIESFLKQAERRKLTASVMMGFVLIATLCLKPRVNLTSSLLARSCVLLSVKRIFNVVQEESSMHWDDSKYKKNVSRLLKCGSANGGDCTKQPILLNDISKNTYFTGVHLQLNNF